MLSIPVLAFLASEASTTLPAGPDLTRYFLACAGLLALVLAGAFGFRKLFARTLERRAARRSLRVVDVLPLGGSKRLVVVSCYERTFLVGQGEKELCTIAELDADVVHGPPHEPSTRATSVSVTAAAPPEAFETLVERAGAEVRPAPRRAVLDNGRGILG